MCAQTSRSLGEWREEFHKFSDNRDEHLLNAHPVTSTELSTLPGLSRLILSSSMKLRKVKKLAPGQGSFQGWHLPLVLAVKNVQTLCSFCPLVGPGDTSSSHGVCRVPLPSPRSILSPKHQLICFC